MASSTQNVMKAYSDPVLGLSEFKMRMAVLRGRSTGRGESCVSKTGEE